MTDSTTANLSELRRARRDARDELGAARRDLRAAWENVHDAQATYRATRDEYRAAKAAARGQAVAE